jgi:predicted amidohydrolase YtcJ
MSMTYRLSILFGLTLAGLGSLPFLSGAERPADLVVLNGNVLTVDAGFRRAEAVAVRDGVFIAVGKSADIKKLAGPATRVIDAKGRMVVPGLNETHVHATGAARGEAQIPFVQLYSIKEIQDWVRARAKVVGTGAWIQLPRVDVTRIKERRIPNRADLDAAAPENPAVFTWQYANKQVQILNTAAIKAAGITKETKAPTGGKIYFDANGEPTGVMDNCGALTVRFMPARSVPEEKHLDSLATLLQRYHEIGITSITDRNSSVDGYRTYEKLKAQGKLNTRVTVTIGLSTDGSVEGTEKAIRALPFKSGDGDEWLRVGPLKVGVDGGILYGTAFMREPYGPSSFSLYGISDEKYRGDIRISGDKLRNIIRTGHKLGWQMSSHVTGDSGVDAVLDAVEASNADSPVAPRRYNLIHAYFPNPETAKRAARLGVCVDTQPAWYYRDGDALAEALGGHRLTNFIGVKTWRDAGVKVALNSDHMQGFDPNTSLNPYNPFLAMQVAVTRKTEGGQVIGANQKISREEALRMTTIDAGWQSFDEQRKGSIEPGKLGDLVVLTGDYLTCPVDQIKDIRAQVTVVGGKVVYERK